MGSITQTHVETEMVFWPPVDSQPVIADFTSAKPEVVMAGMTQRDTKHAVSVHDIRGQESNFTLEKNGFQYVHHEIPGLDQAEDPAHVKEVIIPQTEELVRKVTGASRTIPFADRVRCLAADPNLLASNRAPAHSVHSDFTVAGALKHLESVIPDAAERQNLLQGKVEIINVWRPLKKVERDPLAVCDWSSVDQDDCIRHRLVLPSGWNELGKYRFNPNQRWYYLSGQEPQEALVFRQFDSGKVEEGGMTVPHSAFVDPKAVDGPARESIEIKMFAFF